MTHNYLSRGEYNVTCDRCGRKLKSSQVSKEWTGLIVCRVCLDERHPQDFVRGVRDNMVVPVARPYPPLSFPAFPLPPSISVYGNLAAPLNAGPELGWDLVNNVVVTLTQGTLSSVQSTDVLNGANVIAVESSNGVWEILQYQTAVNTTGNTYILSYLLRSQVGTELNMGNPTPAGARFVFIGQTTESLYDQVLGAFGIGNKPFSPVNITYNLSPSKITISWNRRSKIVVTGQLDYYVEMGEPLDELYEKYGVDILNSSGVVIRTIYAVNEQKADYTLADQISDFGAAYPTFNFRVYQISPEYGDGFYRQATFPPDAAMVDENGNFWVDEFGNLMVAPLSVSTTTADSTYITADSTYVTADMI